MKRYFKIYFLVPLVLQMLAWIPTWTLLKVFTNFKVHGLENLKGLSGPIIFAANHTHELDPILVTAALPFFSRFSPLFYLARESKYYDDKVFGWRRYIYGGLFFKAWGAYPVHSGLKDYERSLQNHIAILKDGGSICIFPEGKMSDDGRIGQAHGGVAFLGYVTSASIIPVYINGAYRITFMGFLMGKHTISLTFKPEYISNYSTEKSDVVFFKTEANSIMKSIISK